MNEMVGSYYTGLPPLENAETATEGGKPATSPQPELPPPPVRFQCQQCGMSFATKSAHTSHARSHGRAGQTGSPPAPVTAGAAPSDPYRCDVCRKTFAVPARLVRHYRTHTGERPFECEFCHKMFSVKENLQVHRRIHTKERPYRCERCGRAFEHSGKLHRHMRIHTGERPHCCKICNKTFIQSGQLVIHLRTHTGEKPYRCSAAGCGKGFTCSKQLKVHSRTHTGEKPYHCDICFRDFGYNHVLKLHRVQHYGAKCYKCTICEDTFKSKKEMEAHIKGHAEDMNREETPPWRGDSGHQSPVGLAPALLAAAAAAAASETPPPPERIPYASSYEQLTVMRHHGYFVQQSVTQFQPALESDSNIVKCVEAALAAAEGTGGAVPPLTPPASTPERSPSPEEAPRDMLSLPLRKRKMYMKPIETAPIRMNSVIQFAKAS